MRKTTWRDVMPAVILGVWLTLFALAFSGCAADSSLPQISTDAAGTKIEVAQAHVDSAESANKKIKPHADKTGQAIVDIVSDEHKAAGQSLVEAQDQLASLQDQIDTQENNFAAQVKTLNAKIDAVEAERDKYKNSIGYRAEQVVIGFAILICVLVGLHVLLPLVALVLVAFFPAAAVAAPILRKIGALCNPLAWFQAIMDHVHCPRCPAVVS